MAGRVLLMNADQLEERDEVRNEEGNDDGGRNLGFRLHEKFNGSAQMGRLWHDTAATL